MVSVLDADPELGAGMEEAAFAQARREALAPLVRVAPGPWSWTAPESCPRSHLGLLVLDGLITRCETVGDLRYTEFLGDGDVLRPWIDSHTGAGGKASWSVVVAARIAVLDYDFALRTCRWPEIPAALLDRAVMRSRSLGVTLAIHRAVRIQDRVLMMLWHLASRWGHVTARGTVLSIPLTHEALAQLVGARRSPVTIAVGELIRQGSLERGPSRSWLLHGNPQRWLQSDAGDELALAAQ